MSRKNTHDSGEQNTEKTGDFTFPAGKNRFTIWPPPLSASGGIAHKPTLENELYA
jgi:hypothetical protein